MPTPVSKAPGSKHELIQRFLIAILQGRIFEKCPYRLDRLLYLGQVIFPTRIQRLAAIQHVRWQQVAR